MEGTVEEREFAVVRDSFIDDERTITRETRFDELGFDSLDMGELVAAFEGEFEISISNEETDGLKTIGDYVKLIEGKLQS